MPQGWRLLGVATTQKDCALVSVVDDGVVRGERDGAAGITNWTYANQGLLEPRYDVPRPRKGVGEVGDLVIGGCDGKLTLPCGRTHCHGGRRGIDVGYGGIC